MPNALKYIVDDSGNKTSILVPIKMWEDLNANVEKLQNKLKVLNGINEGLNEIKHATKTGRKLQTLKEFLE